LLLPSPFRPAAGPAPGPPREEGAAFEIPEEEAPDDLSFTEGCWVSDAGLINDRTKLPIVVIYCLDGKGGGTAETEVLDADGNLTDTCRGTVRVARDGNTVSMVDGGQPCGDGTRFIPTTLSCTSGGGGKTKCRAHNELIIQREEKPYFDASFTYRGPYGAP
jgi:hypothetical protein